jgi:4-hydroxybenzoate polyprenyltransferase
MPFSMKNTNHRQYSTLSPRFLSETMAYLPRIVAYHAYTLFLFTGDQILDAVIPGTAFGIMSALSGPVLHLPHQDPSAILKRLPMAAFWSWLIMLQGCVQNQRSPDSVEEDAINKPWRPMPSKRITRSQMELLLNAVRLMSFLLSYRLNVLPMYAIYFALLAGYNDLGGADRGGVSRNTFCGAAFACLFSSTFTIALGPNTPMTRQAWAWTLSMTLGVLITTIQTSDFRDEVGDRFRGRKTLVTELGRLVALWTVVVAVFFWSLYMPLVFLQAGWMTAILPIVFGGFLIATAVRARTQSAANLDRQMYKMWCLWIFSFCPLPMLASLSN